MRAKSITSYHLLRLPAMPLLNGTLLTHCHASPAGTVGVAEGSALVCDLANSETLAQASTLLADDALGAEVLKLALGVMLATVEDP